MSILLYILIGLAVIIAGLLILGLFTKKSYFIRQEVVILRPKHTVFDFIKLMRNQELYSKWVLMDLNSKKTMDGTDGTVGCIYSWDSENKQVGKGEQTITGIVDGERVDMDLHFIKPMEGYGKTNMQTEAVSGSQTRVVWELSSSMKYPMNLMLVFMGLEGMLGRDMAESLSNLKTVLEK